MAVKNNFGLEQIQNYPRPPEVESLFEHHREVLIITTDPEETGLPRSESNLGVFVKLAKKNGVLGTYLAQVLKKLLNDDQQSQCGSIEDKTSSDT